MATVSYKPSVRFLKRLRKTLGLSRRRAARHAGFGRGDTWGRWERGGPMRRDMVALVSIAYGAALEDICPKLRDKPEALRELREIRADLARAPGLWDSDEQRKLRAAQLKAHGGQRWLEDLWAFPVQCQRMKPQLDRGDHALCHAFEKPVDHDRAFVRRTDGSALCGWYLDKGDEVVLQTFDKENVAILQRGDIALVLRVDGVLFHSPA